MQLFMVGDFMILEINEEYGQDSYYYGDFDDIGDLFALFSWLF